MSTTTGSKERKERFETSSGIEVKRVFRPEDTEATSYERDLGDPGLYPYTRGVQPTMYRGRLWTMRQYAGFATAAESNRRYRYLLEQGTTGLSVAFDLPTQIGWIRTVRSLPARSAKSALRSIRSQTWRRFSTRFRSIVFRRR